MTRVIWAPQAIDDVEAIRTHGDQGLREIIHGNYRIVYRLNPDVVEIATVFHGARLFRLD